MSSGSLDSMIRSNDFNWLIDELRDFLLFSELLTIERVLDPNEKDA